VPIERNQSGLRMLQAVIHDGTVYLAGLQIEIAVTSAGS
jgi:hypothetical protein